MKVLLIIVLLLLKIFVEEPFLVHSLFAQSTPSKQLSRDAQKAPVMLAQRWQPNMEVTGWWMSEKLDGMRGYWTGKELLSRSGKIIQAPVWFTEHFPPTPLDGELWLGRQQFSQLMSIVRSKTPDKRWKNVKFMVFDAPQMSGTFEKRLAYVKNWLERHPHPYVRVLEQIVCQNEAHLLRILAENQAAGGEGLMLRKPQSAYHVGRSSDLLKVKRFDDAEATVIRHLPGSGKHQGRLGALLVELNNGIQFAIGTGFSDQERENPPPVGSIITFKHYGYHPSGKPRFAAFLRIRKDM